MYYVQNSHVGIVSREQFEAVKLLQNKKNRKRDVKPHFLTKLLTQTSHTKNETKARR